MRSDCIEAVTQAALKAGRSLTANDLRGIEGRVKQGMRDEAIASPDAWRKLTPQQQVAKGAERAAKDIVAEKERAVANTAKQIILHDKNQRFIDEQAGKGMRRTDAITRLLVNQLDNKANVRSLEQNREGVARIYKGKLEPIAKATQKFAGFWTDRNMVRDVVRELYGEKTGNATAANVSKIWSGDIAEPLRQQANESGANIAKRSDWAVPQDHSQNKVAKASVDQWINDVLPKLDRSEYVNTDGTPMNDIQMRALLGEVRNTIATDGAWNKTVTEGSGGLKNRGSDRRVIHFKDADSYMDYQAQYGEKSLLETMNGHIDSMARNIAAMQTFGPNAEASFKKLVSDAVNLDSSAGHETQAAEGLLQTRFALATGRLGDLGSPRVAHNYQILKTVLAAGKLGSASLSAITDGANIWAVAKSWKIPALASWGKCESKAWSDPAYRQFMRSQGVGVEAITHGISRYGEEVFGHGTPANIANTMFRISGLNAIDNIRRTATGGMLMHRIGELARDHATLEDVDNATLKSAGVDETTWQVWRKAGIDGEYGMLCPDTISKIPDEELKVLGNPEFLRRQAMQQLVGLVSRDVDTVVPMMTDKARGTVENQLSGLRGKVGGELARSVLQFKSFPIAMFSNHWQRLQQQGSLGSKAAYGAGVFATSAIMGAISVQLKSLVAGNNPQDMTDPKFAGRAMVQGGALTLPGEILVNAWASPYAETIADQLGPMFSTGEQALKIYQDARNSTDPTKKANLGGDMVRLVRGNSGNLWYAKAALDHLIFQRLQDYYSPGYSSRMQQRTQQYYNSGQWWKPSTAASPTQLTSGRGITSPQLPNLATATGKR